MNFKTLSAVALLALSAPVVASAATVDPSSTLLEGDTVDIDAGDIFVAEINGDASDDGGMFSFGMTALSDLVIVETNSLNPVSGFADSVITLSTLEDGAGDILAMISGAALIAGDAMTALLDQGETYWLNASWSDVTMDQSNFDIRVEVAAVPLPAAGWLLLAGLGGLGVMKRRKTA